MKDIEENPSKDQPKAPNKTDQRPEIQEQNTTQSDIFERDSDQSNSKKYKQLSPEAFDKFMQKSRKR